MNYFPYYNFIPNSIPFNYQSSRGLLSRLFGKSLNWSSIINNTQKTLNIINQTIPVVKQVSPVVKNAKTMFKVLNEFKKEDKSQTTIQELNETKQKEITNILDIESGPTFFA